jgi:hypothetical protein
MYSLAESRKRSFTLEPWRRLILGPWRLLLGPWLNFYLKVYEISYENYANLHEI